MILRLPTYYKSFNCMADRCTDNCCIGWEIDIDSKTADFYDSVEGEFGKRLQSNINGGSFVLCGERCPFLNDRNLCDIITTLGEEHLCTICAEHPRYYGWFGNIKEGGIGLCCEEAARIILTEGKLSFYETEIPNEETEEIDEDLLSFLMSARAEIFRYLEKEDISFAEKLCAVLDYAEKLQDSVDFSEFSTISVENIRIPKENSNLDGFVLVFRELEPIDDSWTAALHSLGGKKPVLNESYLTNIYKYFIWRYFLKAVFDGDVLSKLQFAAIGCIMISIMAESDKLSDYVNAAKLYSKEVEYSEENTELLMEMCYTEPCFAVDELKKSVIK